MNEPADPERLLAEALRAQAVRAPMPAPGTPPPDSEPVLPLLTGNELLSGHTPDTEAVPTATVARPAAVTDARYTARLASPAPLSVWWIVTLALLLGLASGAVVGLISVL